MTVQLSLEKDKHIESLTEYVQDHSLFSILLAKIGFAGG